MRAKIVLLAGAALAVCLVAVFTHRAVRPVQLTRDQLGETCGSVSVVTSPDGRPAALKASPRALSRTRMVLEPGERVIVCESHDGWSGVIQLRGDCEISRDDARAVRYEGPCAAGWIRDERLRLLAG